MIIRRNAAPRASPARSNPPKLATLPEPTLSDRIHEMGGSHVAVGVGAGALGNVLGVLAVGKGWIGPKATAGIIMGTGAATTAAGYYWDADHLMTAGVGLTAAGGFSLANQLAVDAYEAAEKKAEEKREAEEKEARENRLAEARKLIQAENQRKEARNGPRLIVVQSRDDDDDDIEYDDDVA
jgi:hypothetical protein